MGVNLDKINFKKLDPENMIKNIEDFGLNCKKAWDMGIDFPLPSYLVKADKFVIVGMGASGIGGEIIKDLLYSKKVLIECVHGYNLPGWVDSSTLVIVCSHSGDTLESVSCMIEAYNKKAKILAITSGGKVKSLAEKYKAPLIVYNLDSQPREAFPYLFTLLLVIFNRLGFYEVSGSNFQKSVEATILYVEKFKSTNNSTNNQAKILARRIKGFVPVIYSSGFLRHIGTRFKTQLNENAKNFAFWESFPELNHNSVEGYLFPSSNVFVLILESNSDHPEIVKRQNITAGIIKDHRLPCERIKFIPSESEISEILTHAVFSDFVSYYLAILNKQNPSSILNINHLKSELGQL